MTGRDVHGVVQAVQSTASGNSLRRVGKRP